MKTKVSKPKKFAKYFLVFKGFEMPWVLILLNLVFSLAEIFAQLDVATMTSDIIDSAQNAINSSELVSYIKLTAFTAVFSILSYYFSRKMEEVITFKIRINLWQKIMHLPAKYYDNDNGNELVSRVTSDASSPASLFSLALSCIVCVVSTVQAFTKLFSYNTLLAIYSLLIIPLTLIACVLFSIFQFKLGIFGATTLAGSLGYLAERIRNFKLIKSALAEKLEEKKGSLTFKEMYKAEFLNWLIVAGYQLANSGFSILFVFIVFVIGSRLIPSGAVTIGDLTGFYMITGIVSVQLMQFFMNVGSVFGTFGTMKKISQITVTESEPTGGTPVPKRSANIVFDNVSFSYNDEKDVIKNLSVTIPAGKVTAVIGGNGAGKSTLFKLITRLYEPKNGKIYFGDENISKYNLTSWRNQFSYVFQNNPLIDGTVRENITYGLKSDISEEELISTAKAANCYDFITEKPNGFNEQVGLEGTNFSGGQGQCVSIARAILRNTNYLLLDEATSNLDAVNEAMVTNAMNNLMKNKTTVMIAHNYAATRNADYIIVMNNGSVEAAGTPNELLNTNDYYREFAKNAN